MHALIVVSHPLGSSLTHGAAAAVAQGIAESNPAHTAEIVDLTREGFDPVFTAADIAAFQRIGEIPPDVAAEQARIARADALVLVFPVYWWTMPALLKGWIDRVFINGWAYEESEDGKTVKKLGHLPVHLLALAAAGQGTWERHGFSEAFKTQIAHGIFDYCGATVVTSDVLLMPELKTPEACLEAARHIGRAVFNQASGAASLRHH
ncbi:NAD(P)H-dependent oxidoreductase [Intestinirhabdus alba]|jgi:NAD(P)H dehydrogenase (quinone)|uniref:Flavodoxin family protein n=1 Tax=Intestinirhabdus alba TaxID=2899544 RepID=A0A6L6ILS8_9ENTR|nr:NAD(P)H-dependent oxidoreductase [Intestinirhabdus alba]MTH47115.1 flavodoxin family protein [Intestinirhabdus alba]